MKKILFILTLFFPSMIYAEGLDEKINEWFKPIADAWGNIVLYPIQFTDEISIPIVLLLLVFGALFFTIRFSFVNISHFPTAVNTVRGKYDDLEHGAEKTDLTVDGDIPDTIRDESEEDPLELAASKNQMNYVLIAI